jgi:CheY-like chemotaxis protein
MTTILIVDDDPTIVDLLHDIVTQSGHAAIGCTQGCEALTLAQAYRPALIVSDLYMPEMRGDTLIAALRTDPALMSIPVFLMSAGTRPPVLPPRTAFLLKPLDVPFVEGFLHCLPPTNVSAADHAVSISRFQTIDRRSLLRQVVSW